MAGQKQGVRWLLAAAVAVALSGCVSVPDAIKGTSPTPQQDLVRVMNAPQLYVGRKRALAVRWSMCKTSRENPLRNRHRTAGQRRAASAGRAVPRKDFC